MPLMRMCPDCQRLIDYNSMKRCPDCQDKWDMKHKQDVKHYDKYIRKNSDVYHDKRWVKLTGECKRRFCGVDIYQWYINNKIVYGNLSHHIDTVDNNSDRRFDLNNLIWLSDDDTHRLVHSAYNKSERDKLEMQKLLYGLIERWIKEYGN